MKLDHAPGGDYYKELELTFNLIDGVGEFLILTGEAQESFIKDILKIQSPEYITEPFNKL